MDNLLESSEFLKLEKEYKFLSRFRENKELDNLNYVIVDIETTGLDPNNNEIIEIGAIGGQITKLKLQSTNAIFTQLIRPINAIPTHIERITGISQEMVCDKPPIKEVISEFNEFIGDAILIAHNADFDVSFLKANYLIHLQKELINKTLCTVKLSRALVPGLFNYKLHTVAKHFNIDITNRHRAMGDCEITHSIWKEILKLLEGRNVTKLNELVALENSGNYKK